MEIIRAYATKNLCYQAAKKMTPQGIVVHSTGADNPLLRRYVDAPNEVGVNIYRNYWNTPTPEGRKVCVHAFIGLDKNGVVRVAEILPLTICCWGVGRGKNGSYNDAPPYIQFEICEDDRTDKAYYDKAFSVAAAYAASLCMRFSLPVSRVVSHREAHAAGYGSSHVDPEHWMNRFGQTMDDFRAAVAREMAAAGNIPAPPPVTPPETRPAIRNGTLVALSPDAVYYTGQTIPAWVLRQHWVVRGNPVGDRVVIDKNEAGTNAILSPVHRKYLIVVPRK